MPLGMRPARGYLGLEERVPTTLPAKDTPNCPPGKQRRTSLPVQDVSGSVRVVKPSNVRAIQERQGLGGWDQDLAGAGTAVCPGDQ